MVVSTHFTEENYQWTSERRKMFHVGIDAEPDSIRAQCFHGTWETEHWEAEMVLGREGLLPWFCKLRFLPPDPFVFISKLKKIGFLMQDILRRKKRSVLFCLFLHWPMSLTLPCFSELSINIRLQFSMATFLSITFFLLRRKIHFLSITATYVGSYYRQMTKHSSWDCVV